MTGWWRRLCVWLGLMWAPPVITKEQLEASTLTAVLEGLAQAGRGELVYRGSFAEFADDDSDGEMETKGEPMATKPKAKQPKRKAPVKARVWLHVIPRGTGKGREWAVLRNSHAKGARGTVDTVEHTKKAALTWARGTAKLLWEDCAQPVQVVIHGTDGSIKADATFGLDPKRSKG